MDLKTYIGIRVRRARQDVAMTQEELASKIDRSVETISNIERGHTYTGLETLSEIGRVLNVPLVSFFEGAESAPRLSVRRAELIQTAIDQLTKLGDSELEVAVRQLEALMSFVRSAKK
jgi:transcriptional regulator with XRE-family HTH domain